MGMVGVGAGCHPWRLATIARKPTIDISTFYNASYDIISYRIMRSRGHGVGSLSVALGEDLFSCLFELQEASCLPWLRAPSLFHSNPLFSSSHLLLVFCQKIVADSSPGEGYGLGGGRVPTPPSPGLAVLCEAGVSDLVFIGIRP